ncbi:MAG: hypothetical protein J6J24_01150 [Clostridia bacterium]|nr:hypothetical protein [Clostridia bacterium]
MKVNVVRRYNNSKYCIGDLYVDGVWFSNTIEDTDRGLDNSMSVSDIKKKKVYAQTAIPTGTYDLTIDIISPKFYQKPYYKSFCNGYVPRVLNVKGFDGILIHKGVNQNSSAGCLIVGYNTIKGQVTNTQQAFEKLYKLFKQAKNKKEKMTITYERTYKVS